MLSELIGKPYIGVDSEWRPKTYKFQKTLGVSVLQIASYTHTFVLDLLKLKNNLELDKVLCKILTDPHSVITGCSFGADLDQLSRGMKQMVFYRDIPKFLDVIDFYKAVEPDHKNKGGYGLAAICENLLGKKLCKGEQVSNWERRPLRKSQMHYAALDAWILPQIITALNKKAETLANPEINIQAFIK